MEKNLEYTEDDETKFRNDSVFMQDTECTAFLKHRLKVLLTANVANKLVAEKVKFEKEIAQGGTTMRLSKERAYRYDSADRECRFYGSPSGLYCAMEHLMPYTQFKEEVVKVNGKRVKIENDRILMRFIVNVKVAERMVSDDPIHHDKIFDDGATIMTLSNFLRRQTLDKCLVAIGNAEKVLQIAKYVLSKIVICSKPYFKELKICRASYSMWSKYRRSLAIANDLGFDIKDIHDIAFANSREEFLIYYSWLQEAGFCDFYIYALHLAAVAKIGGSTTTQLGEQHVVTLGCSMDSLQEEPTSGRNQSCVLTQDIWNP